MTTQSVNQQSAPVEAAGLLGTAAELLDDLRRPDLAVRLRNGRAAILDDPAVVCVVGDFKQGKSSLINAVLGESICPVDDDIATSVISVVYHRDPAQAVVHRRDDGHKTVDEISLDAIAEYVSEQGNPDNVRRIDRIDVGVPHRVLREGLALVDTPGAGALSVASTVATLAFLPYADALLFVSDASAELTRPEIDFMCRAVDVCPAVLFCLSKTDLYPEWRRIAELDGEHLSAAGVRAPMYAISSVLRDTALTRHDAAMNNESGFPRLLGALATDVIDRNRRREVARALQDARGPLDQLAQAHRMELDLLDQDDASLRQAVESLEDTKARLEHLHGPGARWSVVLNDGITDLSNKVGHRFREELRGVSREMDESVEQLKKQKDWDKLSDRLQERVAEATAGVFASVDARVEELRVEIATLLQDEHLDLPDAGRGRERADVRALWNARPIDRLTGTKVGRGAGQGWAAIRGGSGALITFSLLSRFLPAAGAALIFTTPVAASIGLLFGGGQLVQQRRQRVAARRQQARIAVREFLDEVQFQVGDELSELIRTSHRDLRDGFGARVAELLRTYTEIAKQAQANAQQDHATRNARGDELRARVERLDDLRQQAAELERRL
jgi:hypothetical protein